MNYETNTSATTLQRIIVELIEELKNEAMQSDFADLMEGYMADVRVRVDADRNTGQARVVVTYDGAGYEEFSMESEKPFQVQARRRLETLLKEHGYYCEDRNSWSLACYEL